MGARRGRRGVNGRSGASTGLTQPSVGQPQAGRWTTPKAIRRTGCNAVILGVSSGDPNQGFALPCPPTNTQFRPESPDEEDDGPTIRVMTDGLRVWTLEPPWGWVPNDPGRPSAAKMAGADSGSRYPTCSRVPGPPPISGTSRRRSTRQAGRDTRHPVGSSSVMERMGAYPLPDRSSSQVIPGRSRKPRTSRRGSSGAIHRARAVPPGTGDRIPHRSIPQPVASRGGQDAEPLSRGNPADGKRVRGSRGIDRSGGYRGEEHARRGRRCTGVIPPAMAVNLLDFECLARSVPGTEVARTRAWANVDPRFPGVVAPGRSRW